MHIPLQSCFIIGKMPLCEASPAQAVHSCRALGAIGALSGGSTRGAQRQARPPRRIQKRDRRTGGGSCASLSLESPPPSLTLCLAARYQCARISRPTRPSSRFAYTSLRHHAAAAEWWGWGRGCSLPSALQEDPSKGAPPLWGSHPTPSGAPGIRADPAGLHLPTRRRRMSWGASSRWGSCSP